MKIFQENVNAKKHHFKKSLDNDKDNEAERLSNEENLVPNKGNIAKAKYLNNANFHNNSNICYRFGQANIEKALFVLITQMILTALLIYIYIYELEKPIIYLFLISAGMDMILMTVFIYFVMKFRQDDIFSTFSRSLSNFVDVVNSINLLIKLMNYTALFFLVEELKFLFCFWFTLKFLVEIYFGLITVKMFVFCSCTIWLNEKLSKLFKWIQFYVFCCDVEDKEEGKEPEKCEELESNY
jgi:hypothetical protein